jgi:hypothetical protein
LRSYVKRNYLKKAKMLFVGLKSYKNFGIDLSAKYCDGKADKNSPRP